MTTKTEASRVLEQMLVELAKSFDSASRSADDHDIPLGHGEKPPLINESGLSSR
jgi:hypothetical protein